MINPVHFAERHTLFVIISLGEALVAIGATASDIGLDVKDLGRPGRSNRGRLRDVVGVLRVHSQRRRIHARHTPTD